MKKRMLLLLALPALLGPGCTSEDDASEVTLFVTSSQLTAGGGETIYFDIQAHTQHETIVRFEITSFDPSSGTRELFTAKPGTQSYVYRYLYQTPNVAVDSTRIELTFRATDNCNFVQEQHINLTVRNNTSLLPEKSGITLWSPRSGKPDGFSLTTVQPLLCATAAPEEIDIYLYESPDDDPQTLPREWRTQTDVRFAKANSFDYAAATKSSLSAYYAGSQRQNYVRNLTDRDIILVGRGDEAWGAILIVKIFDEEGSADDNYLFNLKML
ncbi:hypothetical protein [Alistipes sp.]|uniref:hypothetical protein n=1 Tax=Alistipes sp. TaxID=1872444 RepID=UPI003AF0CD5F